PRSHFRAQRPAYALRVRWHVLRPVRLSRSPPRQEPGAWLKRGALANLEEVEARALALFPHALLERLDRLAIVREGGVMNGHDEPGVHAPLSASSAMRSRI